MATNLVISLKRVEASGMFQLGVENWDRTDPMQQWMIDDGGRILSMQVSLDCGRSISFKFENTMRHESIYLYMISASFCLLLAHYSKYIRSGLVGNVVPTVTYHVWSTKKA